MKNINFLTLFLFFTFFCGCYSVLNKSGHCYKIVSVLPKKWNTTYNVFIAENTKQEGKDEIATISKIIDTIKLPSENYFEIKNDYIIETTLIKKDIVVCLIVIPQKRGDLYVYGPNGLYIKDDTLLLPIYSSNDIEDRYIRKEKLGCQ